MNEPTREEIMQAAAGDNASALEFLRAFAKRAHWIDDLCDRDKLDAGANYHAAQFAEMEAEWLICIAANQFFQQHRAQLVPAMVIALNAWVDSNQWTEPKDGPEQIRHQAQISVIKGQYHEVAWLVAWMTGGWSKLREVTSKYRAYDFEPEKLRCETVADETVCAGCRTIFRGGQEFPYMGMKFCSLPCADDWVKASRKAERKEPNGMLR